jgi:hypothetical protein
VSAFDADDEAFSDSADSSNVEAVMQNSSPLPDPHFLRFVQDSDTLCDWLQTCIDRSPTERMPHEETLFTTEWQMTSAIEETASV